MNVYHGLSFACIVSTLILILIRDEILNLLFLPIISNMFEHGRLS